MKVIVLSLILLFNTSISISQSGWVLQQSNTTKNLNDVFFINSQTGWIVGDSNIVLKTTNGGGSWTSVIFPFAEDLVSIHFINNNTGWCCGGITFPLNAGEIYKTTDGGNNWFSIYSVGGSMVNNIYFVDENIGFKAEDASQNFASGGSISKTSNGGLSWSFHNPFDYVICSIKFRNANTGWATGYWWSDVLGDSTFILKTTNGGINWNIKFKERGGTPKDMYFYDSYGWVTGKDSCILHTSDDGEIWVRQYSEIPRQFNSIYFINSNTGWAVGNRFFDTTNIIKTTNGGNYWFNLKNSLGNRLNSIFFVDELTGWTAGENYPTGTGLILKTITGGLTSIDQTTSEIISSFQLEQNYPNPFNPNTVIAYNLPVSTFVELKIYDLLGKEIAVLVNEKQNAGSYDYSFSTVKHQLTSGIYYYSLFAAGKIIDTKRMVLIK